MDEYGIPDDHIFSSRDLTFVKGVMRMTNNKGVDLVLNSLSGEVCKVIRSVVVILLSLGSTTLLGSFGTFWSIC
jgi:hypothetical protein